MLQVYTPIFSENPDRRAVKRAVQQIKDHAVKSEAYAQLVVTYFDRLTDPRMSWPQRIRIILDLAEAEIKLVSAQALEEIQRRKVLFFPPDVLEILESCADGYREPPLLERRRAISRAQQEIDKSVRMSRAERASLESISGFSSIADLLRQRQDRDRDKRNRKQRGRTPPPITSGPVFDGIADTRDAQEALKIRRKRIRDASVPVQRGMPVSTGGGGKKKGKKG